MDVFKKKTITDYTAWDLNVPQYVTPDQDLEKQVKRKARRRLKQEIKDMMRSEDWDNLKEDL